MCEGAKLKNRGRKRINGRLEETLRRRKTTDSYKRSITKRERMNRNMWARTVGYLKINKIHTKRERERERKGGGRERQTDRKKERKKETEP